MVELAEGQEPDFAFVACTDSRNSPIFRFNLDPGDAFSFRTMGTLFPEHDPENELSQFINAHLAFYINAKEVPELVIMGHTDCGAAQAIAADLDHNDISPWLIPAGKEALERTGAKTNHEQDTPEFVAELEKEIVRVGLKNLMTYPVVQEALEANTLKVTALLNELKTGTLWELNPENNEFFPTNQTEGFNLDASCCAGNHEHG